MNESLPKKIWFVFLDKLKSQLLQRTIFCCLALLSINLSVYAQSVVKGVVSDNEKNTLIGVTISVTGTNVRAMTDANGKYAINVPATGKSLTFSYVGLQSQTIDINSRATINLTLSSGTDLEAVTIVGYGAVKKSERLLVCR